MMYVSKNKDIIILKLSIKEIKSFLFKYIIDKLNIEYNKENKNEDFSLLVTVNVNEKG